jgi:hypothetical protein
LEERLRKANKTVFHLLADNFTSGFEEEGRCSISNTQRKPNKLGTIKGASIFCRAASTTCMKLRARLQLQTATATKLLTLSLCLSSSLSLAFSLSPSFSFFVYLHLFLSLDLVYIPQFMH